MRDRIGDAMNFLSKLTFQRTWNVIQNLISYYISKWSKKSHHWGLPISIAVEPTTSCNLRCPECPGGIRSFTRPTGMLEVDLFTKIIDDLHKHLLYLIFYFQGEPYLHPQFIDLIRYAFQKGIYTATSTNAHFLDNENARKTVESGLDRLIISIDGTTQETYQAYRIGGNLREVIDGTKNIVKWKKKLKSKTPYLVFQFLVVKPNQHQTGEVYRLAKELCVNEVKLKTAQIYDYKNGSPLIPTIEKYSRYKQNEDGTYSIKNKLLNNCWKMWHSCVITWDGKVVPCCFDKDAQYRLGDLKVDIFNTLWRSQKYDKFRTALLKSRSEIDICKNCSSGMKV